MLVHMHAHRICPLLGVGAAGHGSAFLAAALMVDGMLAMGIAVARMLC